MESKFNILLLQLSFLNIFFIHMFGYLYIQFIFCRWGGYRKWRSDFRTALSLFSLESFYEMVRKCSRFKYKCNDNSSVEMRIRSELQLV